MQTRYLYDVPELAAAMDRVDYDRYWEWEEDVLRPALEAQGWKVADFVSLERDSFGPLTRGVTCTKHGERVRFWYG